MARRSPHRSCRGGFLFTIDPGGKAMGFASAQPILRTASTNEEHVGVLHQDAFVFKPIAGGMNRTAKVNAYIQFLVDLAPSR
jgi:hypothetical protein